MIAVDIGNTKTAIGLFRSGLLSRKWKFATETHQTADHYRFLLQSCLQTVGETLKSQESMILCSVVPEVTREWEKLEEEIDLHVVSSRTPISFTITIDDPKSLGPDRIADAEAAIRKFGTPTIIIDAGTAITVSAINEKKEFLGGAIAPGLGISLEALFSHAARLSQFDLELPERVVGTSSKRAIESGIHFGYSSLIHGLVDRFAKELHWTKPHIIATGGSMERLRNYLREDIRVEENLTLEGLSFLNEKLSRGKHA